MNIQNLPFTIGQWVARYPRTAEVMDRHGIDYCCGGHRPIGDAAREAGLTPDRLLEELRKTAETAKETRDAPYSLNRGDLIEHIEQRYHQDLRERLPALADDATAVLGAHGANHRELFQVYAAFTRLRGELEQHILKEETLLFPALLEGDDADRLVGEIIAEHEAAGQLLKELRSLSGDYKVPEDGCATYRRLYRGLEDLEQELHQHIHLENNVLLVSQPIRAEGDITGTVQKGAIA